MASSGMSKLDILVHVALSGMDTPTVETVATKDPTAKKRAFSDSDDGEQDSAAEAEQSTFPATDMLKRHKANTINFTLVTSDVARGRPLYGECFTPFTGNAGAVSDNCMTQFRFKQKLAYMNTVQMAMKTPGVEAQQQFVVGPMFASYAYQCSTDDKPFGHQCVIHIICNRMFGATAAQFFNVTDYLGQMCRDILCGAVSGNYPNDYRRCDLPFVTSASVASEPQHLDLLAMTRKKVIFDGKQVTVVAPREQTANVSQFWPRAERVRMATFRLAMETVVPAATHSLELYKYVTLGILRALKHNPWLVGVVTYNKAQDSDKVRVAMDVGVDDWSPHSAVSHHERLTVFVRDISPKIIAENKLGPKAFLLSRDNLKLQYPAVDWDIALDTYRRLGKWVCDGYGAPHNPETSLMCRRGETLLFPKCLFEDAFVPFHYATALDRQPRTAAEREIVKAMRGNMSPMLTTAYTWWVNCGTLPGSTRGL